MQVTEPEPKTRQEALWQARARKAKNLSPPKANWLQRQLANLENEQMLEDVFEVPSPSAGGFYFTLGTIKTGAGLTLGSGYDSKGWLNDQVFLSVGAAGAGPERVAHGAGLRGRRDSGHSSGTPDVAAVCAGAFPKDRGGLGSGRY